MTGLENIRGRAWLFGDNIDTDQIIHGQYLTLLDYEEMARHTLEIPRPEFPLNVKKNDVVVAGRNFGGGSSREEAPKAMAVLGVGCVVAESFARIFYRNAFNVGLPAIIVPDATKMIKDGQTLVVELSEGAITIEDTNEELKGSPLPKIMLGILEAGGAIPWFKMTN